jgi:hypothetical protein
MPPDTPDKHSPPAGKLAATLERARDALSERMLELGQKKPAAVAEASYNVVFTGKLTLPDAQAIANLSSFFKLGAENTRRLLQAGRVLKSYPNKAQADKLVGLLRRAGAECRVELEVPDEIDEPSVIQKAAFALQGMKIPVIRWPGYRQVGRQYWMALGLVAALTTATVLWLVLRTPTVQGDSAATYQASIERVVASVDTQQVAPLQRAIALLTETARQAQSDSGTVDADIAARHVYGVIKGKTAEKILAMAEAKLEKQRNTYRQAIAEAEQKITASEQQLAAIAPGNSVVLDKIEVVSAAYGWPPGSASPSLAFSLRNHSGETLMKIYLQGYLYDAGGALLVSNPVTYSVANGVAPGGSATAFLPTQTDSPWAEAAVRDKAGLVFKLRVANAENLQGKALGADYRQPESDRQRYLDWKNKVQAQLDAVKL